MATFGTTTNPNVTWQDGLVTGDAKTLTEPGNVTMISAAYVAGTAGNIKVALYTNNAGVPDVLKTSGTVVLSADAGFHDCNVTPVDLAAGDYWLLSKIDKSRNFYRNGDKGANTSYHLSEAYANAFPDPWNLAGPGQAFNTSIYATYTPGGGGVTVKKGSCVPAMTALLTKFSALKQPREPKFQPRTFPKLSPRHF